MKNKILVMIPCFTKKDYPQDNIYCPIEVGAYYKKIHFLSLRDDQGTNISDRFETFQGLSALYFAYQKNAYLNLTSDRRYPFMVLILEYSYQLQLYFRTEYQPFCPLWSQLNG